jgi:hypothetical protein
MNRAPLLRPSTAQMLVKDLWYRVRREPNLVKNPKSREKPTVWVDFYHKKNWIQTSVPSSAILMSVAFQKEVAMGLFLNGDADGQ